MGFELGFEKKNNFLGNGFRTPPSPPSNNDGGFLDFSVKLVAIVPTQMKILTMAIKKQF